jgi:hypothetical protein
MMIAWKKTSRAEDCTATGDFSYGLHESYSKKSSEKISCLLRKSAEYCPPMKCGYARVSTVGQSVDAQAGQLTKAVFPEVASGAKTDRAQLRQLPDQLRGGRR